MKHFLISLLFIVFFCCCTLETEKVEISDKAERKKLTLMVYMAADLSLIHI